jgi:hypothetical protein
MLILTTLDRTIISEVAGVVNAKIEVPIYVDQTCKREAYMIRAEGIIPAADG